VPVPAPEPAVAVTVIRRSAKSVPEFRVAATTPLALVTHGIALQLMTPLLAANTTVAPDTALLFLSTTTAEIVAEIGAVTVVLAGVPATLLLDAICGADVARLIAAAAGVVVGVEVLPVSVLPPPQPTRPSANSAPAARYFKLFMSLTPKLCARRD